MEEQEEEDENEDEDEDEEKVTNQPGTARRPKQPAGRHTTEVSPPKKNAFSMERGVGRGEKRDEPVAKQDKTTWKNEDTEINTPNENKIRSLPQPENKTKEKMILWACKHTPNGFIASVKILSAQPG